MGGLISSWGALLHKLILENTTPTPSSSDIIAIVWGWLTYLNRFRILPVMLPPYMQRIDLSLKGARHHLLARLLYAVHLDFHWRRNLMPKTKDAEMQEFEAALLRSVDQALRGEYAAVHTPPQIAARKRGRPAGTVKTGAKVSTTIRFDPDLLAALKATGAGWQTRVNEVLREAVRRGKLTAWVIASPSAYVLSFKLAFSPYSVSAKSY